MNEKQKKLNKAALVMLGLGILGCFFLNTASLLPGIAFLAAAVTHLTMLWGLKKALQYSAIAAVIGYFAEYISINTGLVFGSYYYNCNNFAMIAGVPLMVPVGYIYLVFIGQSLCYAICPRLIKKQNILILAALTGFLLTLKDLGLDPIRSTVDQVWIWPKGGAVSGVPVHNFIGWFFVFAFITLAQKNILEKLSEAQKKLMVSSKALLVPFLIFAGLTFFAIISAFNLLGDQQVLASNSLIVTFFALTPFLLLAWFNLYKKD